MTISDNFGSFLGDANDKVTALDEAIKMQRSRMADPQHLWKLPQGGVVAEKSINRILGGIIASERVTVVGGYGGVSKSTLMTTLALGLVLDHAIVGPHTTGGKNVLLASIEDNLDAAQRTLQATMQRHNLNNHKHHGKLAVVAADTISAAMGGIPPNALSALPGGTVQVEESFFVAMEGLVEAHGADVLMMDPLSVLYGAAGMSNEAMNAMMRRFATMAQKLNIGIVLISHMRKPSGGARSSPDQHDIKHGGELVDSARCAITISKLSTKMEQKLKDFMPAEDVEALRQMVVNKTNMGIGGQSWHYSVEGVTITCEDGKTEEVGVVVPFKMPKLEADLTADVWQDIKQKLNTEFVVRHNTNKSARWRFEQVVAEVAGVANGKALAEELITRGFVEVVEERNPASSSKSKVQRVVVADGASEELLE